MTQVKKIFERGRNPPSRRSDLFRWMVKNHDEFAAELEKSTLTWEEIAANLNEDGLRASRGREITSSIAWQTWKRARQKVQKLAEAKKPPTQAALFGGKATSDTQPETRPRFGPAKVRDHPPGTHEE